MSVGGDLVLAIIRQYIKMGKYAFKFVKEGFEDKTCRFMIEKSLTPKDLLEPILELNSSNVYKPPEEGRGKYNYGKVHFYLKKYFGEDLYKDTCTKSNRK